MKKVLHVLIDNCDCEWYLLSLTAARSIVGQQRLHINACLVIFVTFPPT